MTLQEFDNHGFRGGDKIRYDGKEYTIAIVDYVERLIGIDEEISGAEPDTISWKRCENVELIVNK